MNARVVITGMGIVSSLGIGANQFWKKLETGGSGIRPVESFDTSKLSSKMAGEICEYDPGDFLPQKGLQYITDRTRMIGSACVMSINDANYGPENNDNYTPVKIGIILGSTYGHIERCINYVKKNVFEDVTPMDAVDTLPNSAVDYSSIILNCTEINKYISTGISTSLDCIGNAYQYIKNNKAKIIISGGFDKVFFEMYLVHYRKKRLSGSRRDSIEICRPFDKKRDGIILGEGGCAIVLEELDHALERGAKIYGEIVGYGSYFNNIKDGNNNNNHKGPLKAMQYAVLDDANLNIDDIDYINASANSSLLADRIEIQAISSLFKKRKNPVPISSIKAAIGECYGASGALQCAAAVLSINNNAIPPTLNLVDELGYAGVDLVKGESRNVNINKAMINAIDCFGFNSSLIIKEFE